MPSEVARIVVGDCLPGERRRDAVEPTLRDELCDELGVVDHLVAPAELRELVLDGVEAMRALDEDLLHAVPGRRSPRSPAPAAGRGTRSRAGARRRRCTSPRRRGWRTRRSPPQDPHDRPGDLLLALVVRAGAADEEQVLEPVRLGERGGRRGPRTTRSRRFDPMPHGLPWVSMFLKTRARLVGDRRVHEHRLAPHVDEPRDVLDEHRARGLAPAAGGAGPGRLRADHARRAPDRRERPSRGRASLARELDQRRPCSWRWCRKARFTSLWLSGLPVMYVGQ